MSHYLKKELYKLIKEDESIFDFIQDSSLDGLWYWDLENPENEWMNAKFWTVLGYNPEEMPHKSSAWQKIINQDDLKTALENFTKHCENPNHPYDQVVRYRHKNGSTVWIQCRGLAIRDTHGRPVRMLGAHMDVSIHKNNEQALLNTNEKLQESERNLQLINEEYQAINEELRQANDGLIAAKEKAEESEEKYRALYYNAPLSYQSLDENGCFIDINPMWLKTLGYERSEVIGKWYGDFLHPDYVEHFRKNFPAFKKRGYVSDVQFKLRKKDNTFIYVSFEGCIGYTPEGEFKQTYCVFKDITEQKLAEEALRRSQVLNNTMVSNIGDVIVVIDKDGINQYKSPNITKLFGWKPEELVGKSTWDNVYPDDLEAGRKIVDLVSAEPNGTRTAEVRYKRKDGQYVWIEVTLTNLFHNKDIQGILGNYHDISERKRAEQELMESEEMLRNSQSLAHICAYSTDLNINDLAKSTWKCSPEFYKIFGMDETYPHTIEGWAGFIHPDYREEMIAYHQYVVDERLPFNKEYKIIRINDGAERWVHGTGELVYDEKGRPVRMHGAIQDITEHKQTEEALRKSEDLLNESQRLSKVGGWSWEVKTKSMYWTDEACRIHDMRPGEIDPGTNEHINKSVECYDPEDRPVVMAAFNRCLEEGHPYDLETPFTTINGRRIWIRTTARAILEDGKVIRVIGNIMDITDRKQVENKLKESKLFLEKLLNTTPIPIFYKDNKGRYTSFNKSFEEFFGKSTEELIGKSVFDINPKKLAKIYHAKDEELFNTIGTQVYESKVKAKGGKIRNVVFHKASLVDNEGNITGLVGAILDITESKQIEQKIIAAKEKAEESDRLKSAFLANMSHEIRTPMNGILGFARLLKKPDLKSENQQKYIEIIEKSGKRMLNTINDIIDISRIEAGLMKIEVQETNVNEQIESIYTFLKPEAEAKNIKLYYKSSLDTKEAIIKTDSEKVYAILTNLLKNAIKYTEKGSIELGCQLKPDSEPVLLEFYVKDTGIGVPKERHAAIFDRFIQADIADKMAHQGAGLGLAITKSYVEMLGGKIWVESEEARGSVFYFTLPYNAEPVTETINR
jgi:PAS domain S-box-containing protein